MDTITMTSPDETPIEVPVSVINVHAVNFKNCPAKTAIMQGDGSVYLVLENLDVVREAFKQHIYKEPPLPQRIQETAAMYNLVLIQTEGWFAKFCFGNNRDHTITIDLKGKSIEDEIAKAHMNLTVMYRDAGKKPPSIAINTNVRSGCCGGHG